MAANSSGSGAAGSGSSGPTYLMSGCTGRGASTAKLVPMTVSSVRRPSGVASVPLWPAGADAAHSAPSSVLRAWQHQVHPKSRAIRPRRLATATLPCLPPNESLASLQGSDDGPPPLKTRRFSC